MTLDINRLAEVSASERKEQCAECGHAEASHFGCEIGSFCKECPQENYQWEHVFKGATTPSPSPAREELEQALRGLDKLYTKISTHELCILFPDESERWSIIKAHISAERLLGGRG